MPPTRPACPQGYLPRGWRCPLPPPIRSRAAQSEPAVRPTREADAAGIAGLSLSSAPAPRRSFRSRRFPPLPTSGCSSVGSGRDPASIARLPPTAARSRAACFRFCFAPL
eukprot:5897199-Pyramimonas_sp.AAC.1